MSKGVFVFLALFFFVAVCSARPLVFMADLTDSFLNVSNGNSGVGMGWANNVRGQLNHRFRVFAQTNVQNDTITKAWLIYNGTIISTLQINQTHRYVIGDARFNETAWEWIRTETVSIRVATANFPNGAIGGWLRSRPYQGVSFPGAASVVGSNSTSASVGVGFAYLFSTALLSDAAPLPQDIPTADATIINSLRFQSRVVHNVSQATSATFNGPANATSTAPALATYTAQGTEAFIANVSVVDANFFSLGLGLTYVQINSAARPSGDIRGQFYPTLGITRRQVPYAIETSLGNSVLPTSGLDTLRYANQESNNKNTESFVQAQATQSSPGSNYTYEALFKVASAVTRRNFDTVRALTLELNVRVFGSSTWGFEWFDASNGIYIPAGTISTTTGWTAGFIDAFGVNASQYTNNRGVITVRVRTNSATPASMWIDLFGVRSFAPISGSNQVLKQIVKITENSPAV